MRCAIAHGRSQWRTARTHLCVGASPSPLWRGDDLSQIATRRTHRELQACGAVVPRAAAAGAPPQAQEGPSRRASAAAAAIAGQPNQNAYVESFNGRLRDECLNEHWFPTLLHARTEIERWRREYNEDRPKKAIGGMTPAAYAQHLANTDIINP